MLQKKKNEKSKIKRKYLNIAGKKFKTNFLSPEFCHVTHLQDIEKLRGPVKLVTQKITKKFKTFLKNQKF